MWKNLSLIGKCTYYPIPKAALIVYYEDDEYKGIAINYGELGLIHRIVDTAGGKHCGVATSQQVIARLKSSPFWKNESIREFYPGFGNGKVAIFEPNKKGETYYLKYLKDRVKKS